MRRILIASLLVLLTPGPVAAASPSPSPSVSPSATPMPVAAPLPGEVRINEFLPNPVGTDTGNEWVELANVSNHEVNAGGLVIARVSGSTVVTVSSGVTIKAGEVLLLTQLSGSIVNGGDTLVLKSGQTELDRITYDGAGTEGSSWSRLSATEGAWSTVPTPGLVNPIDVPETDSDEDSGASSGSGTATSASTKASAAAAKTNASASKKTTAKKLPASGLGIGPYLLFIPLAMLYWYLRRRFL